MAYTIDRLGKTLGPFTREDIKRHVDQGLLWPTEQAWSTDEGKTVLLSELVTPSRPPEFDTLALFVGPKFETYYRAKWALANSRKPKWSWNWAGLLGVYWLAYRKMYLYASLALAVFVAAAIADAAGMDELAKALSRATAALTLLLPFLGNQLYEGFAKARVNDILASNRQSQQSYAQIARRGGTSWVAALAFVSLFGLVGWLSANQANWNPYIDHQVSSPAAPPPPADGHRNGRNGAPTNTQVPAPAPTEQPAHETFDPALDAWRIVDPALTEKYGGYAFETLDKLPKIVDALRALSPAFTRRDVEVGDGATVLRLRDGRVLYITGGCRPHACVDYHATIVIDLNSGEVFLSEQGEGDGGLEGTAARISRGSAENPTAWERFSGRRDPVIIALLQKM